MNKADEQPATSSAHARHTRTAAVLVSLCDWPADELAALALLVRRIDRGVDASAAISKLRDAFANDCCDPAEVRDPPMSATERAYRIGWRDARDHFARVLDGIDPVDVLLVGVEAFDDAPTQGGA